MVSLRRKKAMREEAKRVRDAALKAARVGRTGQVVRSTVQTSEGDVPVAEALTGGAEAIETSEGLLEDVDALDYGLGLDDVDQYQDAEDAAHEAQYQQIETNIEMGEDLAEALQGMDQAVEDAANALTTANGKNARRRGVTEPDPPEGGWVQGDQWVRDVLVEGVPKPTEVLVWNGTEFVHETMLTGEVLVVGEDGNVSIANGKVTGQALAADAIDGKIITGAVVRTAASGQRLQLDVNGLKAINPSGNIVASLYSESGGFSLSGNIQASGYDPVADQPSSAVISPGRFANSYGYDNDTGVKATTTEMRSTDVDAGVALVASDHTQQNRVSSVTLSARNEPGVHDLFRDASLHMRRVDSEDHVSTLYLKLGIDGAQLLSRGADFEIGDDGYGTEQGRVVLLGSEIVLDAPTVTFAGDTDGWVTAPLGSGLSGSAEWKREFGKIHVRFDVTSTSSIASGAALAPAFTLPSVALEGIQAGGSAGLTCTAGGTGAAVGGVLGSNGNAFVRNLHSSALTQFRGSGSWSAT